MFLISKLKNDIVEIQNDEFEEMNTIESLIEELDAELKKSSDDSSLSSSPNIVLNNRLNNNICSCQIICQCLCHSANKFHNFQRFGSNSSSIKSRNSSLINMSNSPSIRRVSFSSLEWDISLDANKLNNMNSECACLCVFKSEPILFLYLFVAYLYLLELP